MDRIEFLKTNKYPNLNPEIVDAAALADPTSEKKFTDWILRMHSKWELKPSDFPSLTEVLSSYNAIRSRMPEEKRGVNRFFSPLELSNAVVGFMRSEMSGSNKISGNNNKVVYDTLFENDKWLLIRPLTFEAELKYGKSTKWCTAGVNSKNTFYSYMANGYLYIIIDKTLPDKNPLSKMQFQFGRCGGMFMDALDKPINILSFFKQNKIIWDVFVQANEFNENSNVCFKLIHDPHIIDTNIQLSAFRAFGFDVFSIIKNPGNVLVNEAVKLIVQEESWGNFVFLRNMASSRSVQTHMVGRMLEYRSVDDKSIAAMIAGLNGCFVGDNNFEIHYDVFEPIVEKYPKAIFAFDNSIKKIPIKLLEIALSQEPELIKKVEYNKGLIVKLAIKIPSILEYINGIEFSENEIRKISKCKNFEAHMLKKFKVIPEDVQIVFIKKDFENSQYIKKLTENAKKIRKESKKKYDIERIKFIKEREADYGSGYFNTANSCSDSWNGNGKVVRVAETIDGEIVTLYEDCFGRRTFIKSKDKYRYCNV